jgi:glycosyltransferase involved in cell wall biosynthesis
MKLIQPYPDHSSRIGVKAEDRVGVEFPVFFVRHRYQHHAAPSGYDRLCDYIEGEEVRLSRFLYWMGETVLRVPLKLMVMTDGHREYSRYDAIEELEVIRHFLAHHNSIYHFIYGEKSYLHLARFAGRNGNKIIATLHQPLEHDRWMFRSMEHFKALDMAVVVSRSLIPFWEDIIGKGKVEYVPHPVDTGYFRPAIATADARPKRCVFAGSHERDFDALERLVPELLSARGDMEFVLICGDSRCQRIAGENPRVRWIRLASDGEYLNMLQQSDVMVIPMKMSTTNNSILEGLACGLPVVTNLGGIGDYLNSECSYQLPVGDIAGMRDAAIRLLDDGDLRSRMSAAARQQACLFSWPVTARKMVEFYRRMQAKKAEH